MHRPVTPAVDEKHHSDDKHQSPSESFPPNLPARPSQSAQGGAKKSFSEKLKDKVTGTTKEEREREKERRALEERKYYEAHLRFRQALRQSQITGTFDHSSETRNVLTNTGQPQPMGKDAQGHDIYLLPPQNGYGGGYGGFSGYGGRYIQPSPVYNDPNARFIPPPSQQYPGYGRPYGYGGAGLGLPILGGLAGGALLGGLLF